MCKLFNKYFQVLHFKFHFIITPLVFSHCPSSPATLPLHPSLLAGVNLWFLAAGVALDKTAPVELAVALPDARVVVRVVAPATAHHITTVCVGGGAVAQPAPCSRTSCDCVLFAVVGGTFHVDRVGVCVLRVATRFFEPQEGGLAEPRGPDRLDLNRVDVALLQQVANLSELGEGDPAGLGGAGAGYAVTLTLQLHPLL